MPITKITLFYVDDTYEDVDASYFTKPDPIEYHDPNIKAIKEIIVYYSNGKFSRINGPVSININGPKVGYPQDETPGRKKQWPGDPWQVPKYPTGPWCDPTKIVD